MPGRYQSIFVIMLATPVKLLQFNKMITERFGLEQVMLEF